MHLSPLSCLDSKKRIILDYWTTLIRSHFSDSPHLETKKPPKRRLNSSTFHQSYSMAKRRRFIFWDIRLIHRFGRRNGIRARQPLGQINVRAPLGTERAVFLIRLFRADWAGHYSPRRIAAKGRRSRLRCNSNRPIVVQPTRLVSIGSLRNDARKDCSTCLRCAFEIGAKSTAS